MLIFDSVMKCPFRSLRYLVIKKKPKTEVRKFIDFVLSKNIRDSSHLTASLRLLK